MTNKGVFFYKTVFLHYSFIHYVNCAAWAFETFCSAVSYASFAVQLYVFLPFFSLLALGKVSKGVEG